MCQLRCGLGLRQAWPYRLLYAFPSEEVKFNSEVPVVTLPYLSGVGNGDLQRFMRPSAPLVIALGCCCAFGVLEKS